MREWGLYRPPFNATIQSNPPIRFYVYRSQSITTFHFQLPVCTSKLFPQRNLQPTLCKVRASKERWLCAYNSEFKEGEGLSREAKKGGPHRRLREQCTQALWSNARRYRPLAFMQQASCQLRLAKGLNEACEQGPDLPLPDLSKHVRRVRGVWSSIRRVSRENTVSKSQSYRPTPANQRHPHRRKGSSKDLPRRRQLKASDAHASRQVQPTIHPYPQPRPW